ncbi:hypothetical protein MAXJ12_31132 [Mesorhizobium alhagi CCNWXJ12-2]|uniref:Uncharacterized protein n=1 Tax=Mesorhizobium alhagi CCNWXJ12-2 TaxID=1107882 RepID=H0I189_9HYPH|nr:hypothetical protein MAXJ12_31132 [Mesorhizobium alhagi CCNWXJ12-2]
MGLDSYVHQGIFGDRRPAAVFCMHQAKIKAATPMASKPFNPTHPGKSQWYL